MPDYRLTSAAANDLLQIAVFGIRRFGEQRARRYFNRLVSRFDELAAAPERFPRVDHIRKGYRRSVCGVHSIYFRNYRGAVEIVRVLGQQDVDEAL